jgi:hypothetical protein
MCAACPTGKFKATAGNDAPCQGVANCLAGEFQDADYTPSSNRVCEDCPTGRFKTAVNNNDVSSCDSHKTCPDGIKTSGTTSANVVCAEAESNTVLFAVVGGVAVLGLAYFYVKNTKEKEATSTEGQRSVKRDNELWPGEQGYVYYQRVEPHDRSLRFV